EVAGPEEVDAGEALEERVEHPRGHRSAGPLERLDDLRLAALPDADHLAEELRRMLEIAVHDDGGVAARELQSRGDGRLLAEIAAEADAANARIDLGQRGHDLPRPVGRAVVDDDDLVLARELLLRLAHGG